VKQQDGRTRRVNVTIEPDVMDRLVAFNAEASPLRVNVSSVCSAAISDALTRLPADPQAAGRKSRRVNVTIDKDVFRLVEKARMSGHNVNMSKICTDALRAKLDSLENVFVEPIRQKERLPRGRRRR